jgi:hypothetical protein
VGHDIWNCLQEKEHCHSQAVGDELRCSETAGHKKRHCHSQAVGHGVR